MAPNPRVAADVAIAVLPLWQSPKWVEAELVAAAMALARRGLEVRAVRLGPDTNAVPDEVREAAIATMVLDQDQLQRQRITERLAREHGSFFRGLLDDVLAIEAPVVWLSSSRGNDDVVREVARQLQAMRPRSHIVLEGSAVADAALAAGISPRRPRSPANLLSSLLELIRPDVEPCFPLVMGTDHADESPTLEQVRRHAERAVAEMGAIVTAWSELQPNRTLTLVLGGSLWEEPPQREILCEALRRVPSLRSLQLHGRMILDERVTARGLEAMLEVGVAHLSCEITSASPRIRHAAGKPGTIESVREASRLVAEVGRGRLRLTPSVEVGWPDETEAEYYQTLSFLEWFAGLGLPDKHLQASCHRRAAPDGRPGVEHGLLWVGEGAAGDPEVRCRRLMGICEHLRGLVHVDSEIPFELLLKWMLPSAPRAFIRSWCGAQDATAPPRPEAPHTPAVAADGREQTITPPAPEHAHVSDEHTLRQLFQIGQRDGDALEIRFDEQRAFVQLRAKSGAGVIEFVVCERDETVPCYRRTRRFNISLRGVGHSPDQLALANALLDRLAARETKLPLRQAHDAPAPEPPTSRHDGDVADGVARPRRLRRPGESEHVVLCHQDCKSGLFTMSSSATRTLGSFLLNHLPAMRCRISVLDLHSDATVEQMYESILSSEPDVIALSCYVWNGAAMWRLSALLKERHPEVQVVLGGPQLWYDEEDLDRLFAEIPTLDLVVQGEGELALLDYLSAPRHARPPARTVVRGRPLEDLDAIGGPLNGVFAPCRAQEPMMYLECARGCRYRCAYCLFHVSGDIRTKGEDLIRRELAWAKANQTRMIVWGYPYVNDRNGVTSARLDIIHGAALLPDVYHLVAIDYFTVTEPEIEAISKINALVDIGVQSINPDALHISRRGFHRGRLEQTLDWCAKYGIYPQIEAIGGLPGDTTEGFRRTIDYLASFGFSLITSKFLVLPGTELYQRRRELGLRYDLATCEISATATMTEEEVSRLEEIVTAATVGLPISPIEAAFQELARAAQPLGPSAAVAIEASISEGA